IKIAGKAHPKVRSYSLNAYLGWEKPLAAAISTNFVWFGKTSDISAGVPSDQLLFLDVAPESICHSAFVIESGEFFYHFPSSEHSRSGVVSFADGHVESPRWRD